MKILYLTVSAGGGHMKAAEALKESFVNKHPESEHKIIDAFRYINPVLDKLVVGSYLQTVKKTPQLYKLLYERSETDENIYDFSGKINRLLSHKIRDLIDEFKPSAIVCTHPFSLQMLSVLKSRKEITVPVIAILTDHRVHSFWLYDYINVYIVANEYMKQDMLKRGIPENIIYTYGIPIKKEFADKSDRSTLMKEFGLKDNRYTALIMGGSLGYGKITTVFNSLKDCEQDIQIIIIMGKNQKKEKKIRKYSSETDKVVKVVSYTNRVADYMGVSDFIVTKPGGMTLAEALSKELPIFIYSPLPGHEEENAQFFINMGCAVRIWNYDNIDLLFKQTIENPLKLRQMKEMAGYLARPCASANIVDLIKSLI